MSKCFVLIGCIVVTVVAASLQKQSFAHERIIGGSNAPDGAYPYQVSLRYDQDHNCGGSIIDNEWIVTAAHCVYRYDPARLSVNVGSNKLSGGGTYYSIREIYIHEEYDQVATKNDVAMIKVEPITFTDKVAPIALEDIYVEAYAPCTITGWGLNYTVSRGGTPPPDDLKRLDMRTVDHPKCKDQEICTLSPIGKGICDGDSGGPLVWRINGTTKQIGIASWVNGYCVTSPDGFARVSYFIDWFRSKCNCI